MTDQGYNKAVYVISAREYGTAENKKASTFLKELTQNADSVAAFPRHLFFKKAELSTIIPGKMSPQRVDSLFSK